MEDILFVTGNANKSRLFAKLAGVEVKHKALDLHEIQSLDLKEVVAEKAKHAYRIVKQPVIVEDTSLQIISLGRMPGTFIKWFLDELGPAKICRLADIDDDRSCIASSAYAYYDGKTLKYFVFELPGTIPKQPKGKNGFGWNSIFIPKGHKLTLAEMDDNEFEQYVLKIKPTKEIGNYLKSIK